MESSKGFFRGSCGSSSNGRQWPWKRRNWRFNVRTSRGELLFLLLPENMEPENEPLEEEIPMKNRHF